MEEILAYPKLKRGKGKGMPIYEQLRRKIVQQICLGKLTAGQRLPSASKLVKIWNVDYQTVNLALSQIENDGLIRCDPGRGRGAVILTNTTKKCSMVFLRWNNEGFPLEITEGARLYAEEKGHQFSINDLSDDSDRILNAIANPSHGIDGIILVPSDTHEFRKACFEAISCGCKMVFVDAKLDGMPVSSVTIDHVGGAYQATQHLLRLHNEPVWCFGVTNYSTVQLRKQGWASAMRCRNLDDRELVLETPFIDPERKDFVEIDLQDNYELAKKFLSGNRGKKLCVFSATGYAAQGLYKAAAELGMKIGKDLFIAGYGDSHECHTLSVPLTSIAQRWQEVGYEAANVLVSELAGLSKYPMSRLLPAKLRIRKSSTG